MSRTELTAKILRTIRLAEEKPATKADITSALEVDAPHLVAEWDALPSYERDGILRRIQRSA